MVLPVIAAIGAGLAGTQIGFGMDAASKQEAAANEAARKMGQNVNNAARYAQGVFTRQQDLAQNTTNQGNQTLQDTYGQGLSAIQQGYGQGMGAFAQGSGALNQLASLGPYAAAQAQGGGNVARLMADPSAFQADPGYQFRLQQGQQALGAQNASIGGRASGRAMQEMAQFNQGLASQEFNNAFQRASAADAQANQMAQFNTAAMNQALAQSQGLNAQGLQGLASLYQNQAQFGAQGGTAQANMLAQLGQGMNQNLFTGAGMQTQAMQNMAANQWQKQNAKNEIEASKVGFAGKGSEFMANTMGSYMEMGAGLLGQAAGAGAAAAASDITAKKDIRKAEDQIQELLDALAPYVFKYDPEVLPEEADGTDFYGIMAQDLEASEAGRTLVSDQGGVKRVDIARALMLSLAAVAQLNNRIRELEGR